MAQLTANLKIRPIVNSEMAVNLIKKLYGFNVNNIQELNSYDDKNYRIICDKDYENIYVNNISIDGYVLKITNSLDSQNENIIKGQNRMMLYLNQHNINCPVPILNLNGLYYSLEKLCESDETTHIVRLLVYCPGEILCNVNLSRELYFNIGLFIANLSNILKNFYYPSYENHKHLWSLLSISQLRDYIYVIDNDNDKSLVIDVINNFEMEIIGNINKFDKGIIHGDLNEQNIIINNNNIGIIDFGDAQYSYVIFELILSIFYMIMQARDIKMGKYIIDGYQSIKKLSIIEKKILKSGVCARACQSLVLGLYSHLNDPDNNYIMITQKSGWEILRELWPMSDEKVAEIWEL